MHNVDKRQNGFRHVAIFVDFHMCGITVNVCLQLKNSVPNWKPRLSYNNLLTLVTIGSNIFQGAACSSQLFVITSIPLLIVLCKVNELYEMRKNGIRLNHILSMDYLNTIVKNKL